MSNFSFSPYDTFVYLASGLIVLVGLDYTFVPGLVLSRDSIIGTLTILLVGYLLGHIISHVSAWFWTNLIVHKLVGDVKDTILSPDTYRKCLEQRKLAKMFASYLVPLAPLFRDLIEDRAARDLGHVVGKPEKGWSALVQERAFVSYCFSKVKHEEIVYARFEIFSRVCDFCRNVSFALTVVGLFLILRVGANIFEPNWQRMYVDAWLLGAVIPCAVVLFSRYIQFFRHRLAEVMESYATGPFATKAEQTHGSESV